MSRADLRLYLCLKLYQTDLTLCLSMNQGPTASLLKFFKKGQTNVLSVVPQLYFSCRVYVYICLLQNHIRSFFPFFPFRILALVVTSVLMCLICFYFPSKSLVVVRKQ